MNKTALFFSKIFNFPMKMHSSVWCVWYFVYSIYLLDEFFLTMRRKYEKVVNYTATIKQGECGCRMRMRMKEWARWNNKSAFINFTLFWWQFLRGKFPYLSVWMYSNVPPSSCWQYDLHSTERSNECERMLHNKMNESWQALE